MSILDRPEPLDCNGRPLAVGDTVRHSLADQFVDDDGKSMPPPGVRSFPFQDTRRVMRICNSMCVELGPRQRFHIPIFMSDFLEKVG